MLKNVLAQVQPPVLAAMSLPSLAMIVMLSMGKKNGCGSDMVGGLTRFPKGVRPPLDKPPPHCSHEE
jgi:hypothetical protein